MMLEKMYEGHANVFMKGFREGEFEKTREKVIDEIKKVRLSNIEELKNWNTDLRELIKLIAVLGIFFIIQLFIIFLISVIFKSTNIWSFYRALLYAEALMALVTFVIAVSNDDGIPEHDNLWEIIALVLTGASGLFIIIEILLLCIIFIKIMPRLKRAEMSYKKGLNSYCIMVTPYKSGNYKVYEAEDCKICFFTVNSQEVAEAYSLIKKDFEGAKHYMDEIDIKMPEIFEVYFYEKN